MNYYLIKPEVAGGLGEHTKMDTSTHPPIVEKLHYVFDGWSGDVLLTTFPCFIVTSEARKALEQMRFTGFDISCVEVSKSDIFIELHPSIILPEFYWLKVNGVAGVDDFGIANNRLIVTEKVLQVLQDLGLKEAIVCEYSK